VSSKITEEEEKNKALFQLQGQLWEITKPLRRYGQGDYVDLIVPEIMRLVKVVFNRVDGQDLPIKAKQLTYTP